MSLSSMVRSQWGTPGPGEAFCATSVAGANTHNRSRRPTDLTRRWATGGAGGFKFMEEAYDDKTTEGGLALVWWDNKKGSS